MAGSQPQIPNQEKTPVFSIEITKVNDKVLRISDGSDYYVHLYLSENADPDDISEILGKVERVRILKFMGGRSVELLDFRLTNADIFIGQNTAGFNEYLTISIDFGDDNLPMGCFLKDLLEGKISVRQYYIEVLDYVQGYVEEVIKSLIEEEEEE